MTGEIAGAADIATGAIMAGAVEGGAGKEPVGSDGHFAERTCLNCGTGLVGHFCHECGQQGHLHRTLGAFGHDFLHGVLHFEGKIWKTLPMLAWRPGDVTRRYIHGERAKFVSPLALFLFSVFLMFGVISLVGGHLEVPEGMESNPTEKVAAGVAQGKNGLEAALADIDAKIKAAEAKGEDTSELKKERAAVAGVTDFVGAPVAVGGNDGKQIANIKTGWARLDHGIKKANENPGLLLYKLQASAYKYSWMLIPLSVPFVWLLFFWRRQYKLYDHTVFVTYSLSFFMLLATLTMVLSALGLKGAPIAALVSLVPPIHLYRQLKQAYSLSRAGALVRTFLLLISGLITSLIFILLLLGLGLLG